MVWGSGDLDLVRECHPKTRYLQIVQAYESVARGHPAFLLRHLKLSTKELVLSDALVVPQQPPSKILKLYLDVCNTLSWP